MELAWSPWASGLYNSDSVDFVIAPTTTGSSIYIRPPYTRHMAVGYDELGGMLLERLRVCVERRMPIGEIIPQMLDTCETYVAFNYGEVIA